MKTSPLYALTLNSFLSPEEKLVFETNIDIILSEFPDLSLSEQNLALSLAGQYVSKYQAQCRVNRFELEVKRGCEAARLKNQESLHLAIRDLEKSQHNIRSFYREIASNRAKLSNAAFKGKIDALTTSEENRGKIFEGRLKEMGVILGDKKISDDVQGVVDALSNLDSAFSATTTSLAEGLPRVSAVANGAGVSFEETKSLVLAAQLMTNELAKALGKNPKILENTLKSAFVNFYNQHKAEEPLREVAGKYNSKFIKEILDLEANYQKEKPLHPTVTIRNIIEVLQSRAQGGEGIKIGLFSESWHGAKVAFESLEKFIDIGDGADYVKHDFPKWNQSNPSKGTDRWTLHTKNSTVTALPLSDKVRGYRFDVIILVGEIPENSYQEIILPMSRMMSSSPLFPVSILSLKD